MLASRDLDLRPRYSAGRLLLVVSRDADLDYLNSEDRVEFFADPQEIRQDIFRLIEAEMRTDEAIELTLNRGSKLVKGKRGITAEAALDLAEVLGTSAKLWMNLQATYELGLHDGRRFAAAQLHRQPDQLA